MNRILKQTFEGETNDINRNINKKLNEAPQKMKLHKPCNRKLLLPAAAAAVALDQKERERQNYSRLPLLPPFLRVLSVGMGVTSSGEKRIMKV